MKLGFKGLHPVAALVFFVFAFAFSLMASNPFSLSIAFFCGAAYDLKLQGKKAAAYIFKFILPLIILITVFNGLFSHYGVTVLFVMKNGNSFTLEALAYGLVSAVRAASMLLWLDCFNEILTSEKIVFLFGRFSPRLALVISIVLRFIPLVRSQSSQILRAEKGIGNSGEIGGFFARIRSAARRLSVLVSWTMEKGIDTSDSMHARGYGLKGRTSYDDYVFLFRDAAVVFASVLAAALGFACKNRLAAYYNPIVYLPNIDLLSALVIVLFAAVLIMPLIFDLREEKLWSISK